MKRVLSFIIALNTVLLLLSSTTVFAEDKLEVGVGEELLVEGGLSFEMGEAPGTTNSPSGGNVPTVPALPSEPSFGTNTPSDGTSGSGSSGGSGSSHGGSSGGSARESKLDKINKSSIVLFIGSPNALVNGKKTLIDPANNKVIADTVDGRTLVPVRFIAENYGAEVGWDDPTRTVTLKMKDKLVTIVLDKKEIDINGQKIEIDVPAKTFQDRTMLPLRAFVENVMGKKVFWDDRGLIVITDEQLLDPSKDKATINKIIENVR